MLLVGTSHWVKNLKQLSILPALLGRHSTCFVLLSEAQSAEELKRQERLRRKQQRQQEFQVLRAKIQDQKPFQDKGTGLSL